MNLLDLARQNFAAAPLGFLIAAHLLGDFVLQDDAMARAKANCSWMCYRHIAFYSLPFAGLLLVGGLPLWAYIAVMCQHFAQDRWALHLRWMELFGQTPPDRWPIGPLCVDQAMHIGFIAVVALFI